jgi:hypothetical protein
VRRLVDLEVFIGGVQLNRKPYLTPFKLKGNECLGQRLVFDLAVTPGPGHCLARIGLAVLPLTTVDVGCSAQRQFGLLSLSLGIRNP